MEMLTARELAGRLKISQRQVWKLASSGRLPEAVRIGRSVRWRESDIARWVQLACPNREQFESAYAASTER